MLAFLKAILLSLALSTFALAGHTQEESLPTAEQSLEGRIVYCKDSRDLGERGFRFDQWQLRLSTQAVHKMNEPMIGRRILSISFAPRFLNCERSGTANFVWVDQLEELKRNQLVTLIYEQRTFLKSLLSVSKTEVDDFKEEVGAIRTVHYELDQLLNARENSRLNKGERVSKVLEFYPADRLEIATNPPEGGLPANRALHGSWYKLTLEFEKKEEETHLKASNIARGQR